MKTELEPKRVPTLGEQFVRALKDPEHYDRVWRDWEPQQISPLKTSGNKRKDT